MASTKPQGLKWPDDLYNEIKALSIVESRSFSSQVVYLVKEGLRSMESYGRYKKHPPAGTVEDIAVHEKKTSIEYSK